MLLVHLIGGMDGNRQDVNGKPRVSGTVIAETIGRGFFRQSVPPLTFMTGLDPRLSGTVVANQLLRTFQATVFSFGSSSAGLTRGSQGTEASMLPAKDGRIKSGRDENGVLLPAINPFP
ncbi:hypothetical protein [Skermanella pratensis]|uniref:hypothetical protein n=1 Tax=Skermanella pratensis TaxID=2233999 RepID=UPI001301861A|nr:hypothetical protein [Skermanella pratensis]